MSVTKFENSRCYFDFLDVSQEAKVAPLLSAWPLCPATMPFGNMGCPKNAKNYLFLQCKIVVSFIFLMILENQNGPKKGPFLALSGHPKWANNIKVGHNSQAKKDGATFTS